MSTETADYFHLRDGFPAIKVKMLGWTHDDPEDERLIPYLEGAKANRPDFLDAVFEEHAGIWWEETVAQIAQECGLEAGLIEQEGRSGGWLVYRDQGVADALRDYAHAVRDGPPSSPVEMWFSFVDRVLVSLAHAAEDMRREVALWYAQGLDDRRERLIEEWNAAHPQHTTRPATDDPAFGWSRSFDEEGRCGVCDGWGWIGASELIPCPQCERGQRNQLPRLGIDVPSQEYEIAEVFEDDFSVKAWGLHKARERSRHGA